MEVPERPLAQLLLPEAYPKQLLRKLFDALLERDALYVVFVAIKLHGYWSL
jgi:hypothetical protein